MSKSLIIFFILFSCSFSAFTQNVGVGTADPKARLEVFATDDGILIPRIELTSTNIASPVASPEVSTLVYNTATAGSPPNHVVPGFYYWDGAKWVPLGNSTIADDDWKLTGNAGITAPAAPANYGVSTFGAGENRLGTTDANPLTLGTGNIERMRILSNGNIGIGTALPDKKLEIQDKINSGHVFPANGLLRLRNSENTTCAGTENIWDFRVGNCGQMGITTYQQNSIPYFNILKAAANQNTLSDGAIASFNMFAPIGAFILNERGNIGINNFSPLHKVHIIENGNSSDTVALRIDEYNTGNAVHIMESGNGSALVIESHDNGVAINSEAKGLVSSNHFGHLLNNSVTSSANSLAKYGLLLQSSGTWNGAGSINTGLAVNVSGGTTNYAAVFSGGNVGIGTATPAALLDVSGNARINNNLRVGSSAPLTADGSLSLYGSGSGWQGYVHMFNNNTGTDGTDGGVIGMIGNQLIITNQENDAIRFSTNNMYRLEISADGHFLPAASNVFDLGSSTERFKNMYLAGEVNAQGAAGTYGSVGISGSKNGYSGIHFPTTTPGSVLMVRNTDGLSGVWRHSGGWSWYFTGDGVLTVGTVPVGRITGTLPVTSGGTGATSAAVARTNLGATTVGGNLFTIADPSAIGFLRINADNSVSALDAATFRTAIGAGTGSGTVTSVAVSGGTTGLTVTGSPISSSGTITLSGTLGVPHGGTGTTSFASGRILTGNGTNAIQSTLQYTTTNVANALVQRDINGDTYVRYGFAAYFNMSHAAATRNSDNVFYSSNDAYIRKNTAAGMKTSLGLGTLADQNSNAVNITGGTITGTSVKLNYQLITGTTTLTDSDCYVHVGGGGDYTITFPNPATAGAGAMLIFRTQYGTGSKTFASNSGSQIRWLGTPTPGAAYNIVGPAHYGLTFISDGSVWNLISYQ